MIQSDPQDEKTPAELLAAFYAAYNLPPDGGRSSSSVKIELTPKFCFYLPNFEARRKAVVKHDIHHLLTGYSAGSISGEGEISAWEIASGCRKYRVAFLIDTSGLMIGLLVKPIGILRAFARGRRTCNLYHDLIPDEQALNMKLWELRVLLGLDKHPITTKASFSDVMALSFFLIYGIVYSILSYLLLPFILLYTLYVVVKPKGSAEH
jgi:hypothetical protein